MVLTRKHRTSTSIQKEEGTTSNEPRKTTLIKKTRSPDKIAPKQKDTKIKSNLKGQKILKSASVTKKKGDTSKIPVPLSKSSTYKQVTVQKHHKMKALPAKIQDMSTSNKPDVKFVMSPKNMKDDIGFRVKQMKKLDADNINRIKNQYFSSVLADIHKTDLETTLRKYGSNEKSPTDQKRRKRKSIKKKPSPKIPRTNPVIVSEQNNNKEFGGSLKDTPSMTTHFLEADSQTSQIPVTAIKRLYKTTKTKKSPRSKLNADGKDVKSTQLSQHKKKSKTHTLKLNRVQSSDSVPNLPIREIKHNDSFVLSAKKLENSSMKRAARPKKNPEQLKLKTKRPKSAHHPSKVPELKNDSTKPEQLKSCLKKTWDENDFTAVNTKYEMNFGLVPLIVN